MPNNIDRSLLAGNSPTLKLENKQEWHLTPGEALQIQNSLRERVQVEQLPIRNVQRVAGVDASYRGKSVYAAAVVMEFPELLPSEEAVAEVPISFPYIPGLLSFREAPGILTALEQLTHLPDILIVDGHGQAHPRRFGIACHLGVLLDLPVIGCAKSILTGQVALLESEAGSTAKITSGDEVLGVALRTRKNVKPVYVSCGHRVDLESAIEIILACGKGFRFPEPIRRAHSLAKEASKSSKYGIK